MFLGEYEYKVDVKGRVPVPPKFRQELVSGVFITRGPEKCIFAYTKTEWDKVAVSLSSKSVGAKELRQLNRVLFGEANDQILDAQGRIMLSPRHREYAGISDGAIVVGANDHIEIWSKNLWEAEKASAEERMGQLIENLEVRQ
jgi:MraZ protein